MKCAFFGFCLIFPLIFFSSPAFAESENESAIRQFAESAGAYLYWDTLAGRGLLEKDGHTLSFCIDNPLIMLDNRKLALVSPPIRKNGDIFVSEDFQKTARELFSETKPLPSFDVGAVVIDAGHGGKDPGAMEKHTINGKEITVREKDITLAVAKELYAMLKKKYPSKRIMLTRSTDTYLSLEQRVDIANSVRLAEHEAVLYISIHVNAAFDKKASGFEVWYLSPGYRRTVIDGSHNVDRDVLPILNSMMEEEYTTESILLAKFILDALSAEVGAKSRGIKQEEWFVVRNVNMPSVLIEVGFLTNYEEARLLADAAYLRKLASGIYNGTVSFISHFERSRGFTGTH